MINIPGEFHEVAHGLGIAQGVHVDGFRLHWFPLHCGHDYFVFPAEQVIELTNLYSWLSGAIFMNQALKRSHQLVNGSFVSTTF
jgi:hypothetical protein